MGKIVTNSFLFCVGFVLSVIVTGRGDLFFPFVNTRQSEAVELESSERRVSSFLREDELAGPVELEPLLEAVRVGDLSALQPIRTSRLERVAEYRTRILPALKKEGISTLRRRFIPSDLENWQRAAYSLSGGPSTARLYVDDVTAVNKELGAYLETAAQLFHELYVNTKEGVVTDADVALASALENAEELLALRKRQAVPARLMLDPAIVRDPVFITAFEEERARLTAQAIEARPDDIETHLQLLAAVEPRLAGGAAFDSVHSVVKRLAIKASPGLRERFFSDERAVSAVRSFAQIDPAVRSSLASLYALGAVDAFENSNRKRAHVLLSESIALQPGLPAQEIVAGHLKESERGKASRRSEEPGRSKEDLRGSLSKLGDAEALKRSMDRLEFPLFPILLGLVGLGALWFIILYFVNRRTLRHALPAADSAADNQSPFSDWQRAEGRHEGDFYAEPEIDLRLANSGQ